MANVVVVFVGKSRGGSSSVFLGGCRVRRVAMARGPKGWGPEHSPLKILKIKTPEILFCNLNIEL